MPFRQTTVAGLPALALFTDDLELIAIPAAGARISHLRLRRGREWLWRNPVLGMRLPPADPGTSPTIYVDRFDSGGWDECFPTVAACPRPGAVAGMRWLPDHGELWHAEWRHDVFTQGGRTVWRAVARCATVPAEFARQVTLTEGSPRVELLYHVRSIGAEPFAWLWSAHPLLTARPGSALELPGVARMQVAALHGRHDLRVGDEIDWPLGGGDRFVLPEPAPWALKLFTASPPEGGRAVLSPGQDGEALELHWDSGEIPHCGVWLNAGGFGVAGREGYTLAVEPCMAPADGLDQAGAMAPILRPGEERNWRITVVLRDELR